MIIVPAVPLLTIFSGAVLDLTMVFFFALAAREVFDATLPGGALARPRRLALSGRLERFMLFKIAVLLFVAWVLGLVGLYTVGRAVHLFLLVGLLLLMIGALRARDATRSGGSGP